MSTPRPVLDHRPSWGQVLALILGLGLRRLVNRTSIGLARRKPGQAGVRRPTARRRRSGLVLLVLLALIVPVQTGMLTWRFLAQAVEAGDGRPVVHPRVLETLASFSDQAGAHKDTEWVRQVLLNDPSLQAEDERRRSQRLANLVEVWRSRGSAGFCPAIEARPRLHILPSPGPQLDRVLTLTAALLALALGGIAFSALGLANSDLGKVESTWLWLGTLPVSDTALLSAKLVEYLLINPLHWGVVAPFLATCGLCAGWGWSAIPAAVVASLILALPIAAWRLTAETWLRLHLRPQGLKNAQALCTVLGLGLLIGVYAVIFFHPGIPPWFLALAPTLGHAGTPQAWLLAPLAGQVLPLVILVAASLVLALAALVAASRSLRHGLVASPAVWSGRRGLPSAARPPTWRPFDGLGKDLRLLIRDRNLLVQTIVLPAAFVTMNAVVNPRLLSDAAVWGTTRNLAALAFGVGAYTLLITAVSVLSTERQALWLFWTSPSSLAWDLRRKTWLWAGMAAAYTVAVLVLMGPLVGFDPRHGPGLAGLAVGLVVIYAFIAAGMGAAATDPFATTMNRRIAPSAIWMFFLLLSLGSAAIAQPAAGPKIVFLILSLTLAWALWQRLDRRLAWLLDPVASPPPELDLAMGAMAAMAFVVVQTLLVLMLLETGLPMGPAATIGFIFAGVGVALASLGLLRLARVPDLTRRLGLRPPTGGGHLAKVAYDLTCGFLGGALGLSLAIGWLLLLSRFPGIREQAGQLQLNLGRFWLALLAVIAAPVCEEFLFRGLIFQGLRSSLRPWPAILGSALLFAVVHPPPAWPAVFAMGAICAWLVAWRGWLLPAIVCHATYNGGLLALQVAQPG